MSTLSETSSSTTLHSPTESKDIKQNVQFSCTQENLHTALNLIGHITARQGTLPILSNVLIRAESNVITLITTNLELAMTYHLRGVVGSDGTATVNAKLLTDVVGLLPNDRVDVRVSGGALELACRGNTTKIRGLDAAEFPLIPDVERRSEARVDVAALRSALGQVVFATAIGEGRPELAGSLWSFNREHLTVAATDSYRLGEAMLPLQTSSVPKETSVIVPLRTIQELLRVLGVAQGEVGGEVLEVTITPSSNQLLVTIGCLSVTSRLVDRVYPDYAQIIPKGWTTRARVARGEFQTAARAASLFSRTGVNDIHLRCIPEERQLIVRSENAQLGEHQAIIDAEIEGDPVETILNGRYLLEGLAVVPGEHVEMHLNGATAPVAFRPTDQRGGYLYIVMPIK